MRVLSPWIAKSACVWVELSCTTRVTLHSTCLLPMPLSANELADILSGDDKGLHSGWPCAPLAFCYTQCMRTQLEQRALVIPIYVYWASRSTYTYCTYCFLALYLPLQYLSAYSPLSSLYCSNRSESSLSSSLVQMWRVTSLFLHMYIDT